jgi:hypothetical protein
MPLTFALLLSTSAWADTGAPDNRFAPPEPQPSGPTYDVNLLGGTGAPTTNSVTVEKIVITQSIQNNDQTVQIQKGRKTFVRLFLNSDTERGWGQVSGVISVTDASGTSVSVDNIQSTSLFDQWNDQLEFKRNWESTSLNFELPESVLDAGTYTIQTTKIEDRYNNNAEVPCANCATQTREYTAVETAPLRLTVIGLTYTVAGTTYQPRPIDYNLINSWLLRAYPIAELIYNTRNVASTNASPFTCGQANAQVAIIRAQDVAGGTDARTHYYGLVDDGGDFMRGCAAVPAAPNPAAIGSGPTGPGTWGWDFDGSYGDWYTAHELGHTLGRAHIGGTCGATGTDPGYPFPDGQLSGPDDGYVGFDAGVKGNDKIPRRALPGAPYVDTNTWHDVMSYCKYQWVSSYTFDALRTRIIAENALPPATPGPVAGLAAPASPMTGEFLHIVALVNFTRASGEILSVHRVKRATQSAPSEKNATIRLSDRSGGTLGTFDVEALKWADLLPESDETGMLDVAVPYLASASRIDLLMDGKVIGSIEASANPPRVTSLAISARSGRKTLRWKVRDADGDVTTSIVQVSYDQGETWQTLAVGLKENTFPLSPELAAQPALKYRVTVSDGYHSRTINLS